LINTHTLIPLKEWPAINYFDKYEGRKLLIADDTANKKLLGKLNANYSYSNSKMEMVLDCTAGTKIVAEHAYTNRRLCELLLSDQDMDYFV
jgi:hypothetical protein